MSDQAKTMGQIRRTRWMCQRLYLLLAKYHLPEVLCWKGHRHNANSTSADKYMFFFDKWPVVNAPPKLKVKSSIDCLFLRNKFIRVIIFLSKKQLWIDFIFDFTSFVPYSVSRRR